ncbi:sugar phosphate nucleotidyltransferase [Paenibacillus sp. BR2-3]|uniref:sugar phosphate nucleotidyltransferase n=1 Tax=Paenibacillus sp. BR2-3 TaxID=3048494 RepID=UPI0039779111
MRRLNLLRHNISNWGSGTRFYLLTRSVSKKMLPTYDHPMIYYSLSVLMFAGIISTLRNLSFFENLLGDCSALGMKLLR